MRLMGISPAPGGCATSISSTSFSTAWLKRSKRKVLVDIKRGGAMVETGQAVVGSVGSTSDRDALYSRYKWTALLGVSFCYLFYYTGRQTFGFAIPGIQKELGLSKEMLGWVSAAMLWAYAVGQSINGNLGDKFGGRTMMFTGAVLSFAANWATSFGTGFVSILLAWGLNGMGFAPGSRLVSQ